MKLKTRFEYFLAKIAGKNVDIETLTPPAPANTMEELMLEIAGKQLPEVTNDDEGKILTVVDGEWDKGEASSGGEFIVTISYDESADKFVADKTFEEIKTAVETGLSVKAKSDHFESGRTYYMPLVSTEFNNY